jgi:guanylate kinase
MDSLGQLFVLSGPSGVGKSSLREQVCARFPDLAYSVSHTTRPQREGETEGRDYHFVSENTFIAMRDAGDFVEWARVYGNYYGTSHKQITNHLHSQGDLLLEIDVQGARQVKAHFPQACFIFVLPPDGETVENRLRKRGTEARTDLEERLQNASRELQEAPWFDYLIVNDVFAEAVEALAAIVLARRQRKEVVLPRITGLLQPK